jgi:hypothetical protein
VNHATTPVEWEHGNRIACYAPSHNVMCHDCLAPIEAGTMFQVHFGRPTHPSCPTDRSHLRLVQ